MSIQKGTASDAVTRTLLMTLPEVATELRCSIRACWRMISKGDLKVIRLGRSVRVTRSSVELLVEQGGSK